MDVAEPDVPEHADATVQVGEQVVGVVTSREYVTFENENGVTRIGVVEYGRGR